MRLVNIKSLTFLFVTVFFINGIVYASNPVDIGLDTTISAEINPSADVDQYNFNGTQGDIITVRTMPQSGSSRLQLNGPDGVVLKDTSQAADGSPYYTPHLCSFENFSLPATGKYTIQVMSKNGNEVFQYALGLFSRQHILAYGDIVVRFK